MLRPACALPVALLGASSSTVVAFVPSTPHSAGALRGTEGATARGDQHVEVSDVEGRANFRITAILGSGLAATGVVAGSRRQAKARRAARDAQLVVCNAVQKEDVPLDDIGAIAQRAISGAAAAAVVAGSLAESANAYPIFAQQNYANPREANGKIVCANCHLASKPIDVRVPHEVFPDTIFKMKIDVPAKYDKRMQPSASGDKVPMNVGAIAIMPEGWKLAPKDRLPKVIKKEMKGLAWAPYSKELPNIVVAGPVPGNIYNSMILPVLAPVPDNKKVYFEKGVFFYGGNRGRGQVYPEGNQSNNNQFTAKAAGKITAIEGDSTKKLTITQADGATVEQEILPGATVVVEVGDTVKQDQPVTTNPNVGGFGQEEKDVMLQDVNRLNAWFAVLASILISQVSFVLKKKQFEKVQLAEGF